MSKHGLRVASTRSDVPTRRVRSGRLGRALTVAVVLAASVVAPTLIAPALPAAAAAEQAAPSGIGPVVWADEFNAAAGTRPDPGKWRYDIGGGSWGNNEMQYYTDRAANAAHDGQGNLVITARREGGFTCHYGPCEYISARLLTKGTFQQAYGRFEARIKVPRGQGIWPAFWMLGGDIDTNPWPHTGEIDIMENIGREPNNLYGTLHGPGYSGGEAISSRTTLAAPLADAFHTYAVEWEPNLVTWFVDGREYARKTPADLGGDRWVFDHPFFMILNVAVGGYWPGYPDGSTQFPQSMLVDWVRVSSHQTDGGGGGTGQIVGLAGKCLDVAGANPNDGTRVQLHDCNGNAAQQWTRPGDGTLRAFDKCLDVAGGGTTAGTPVQIAHCSGNPAQQWVYSGGQDLVNPQADKCLDVTGGNTANGTPTQIWTCNGSAAQKWTLR